MPLYPATDELVDPVSTAFIERYRDATPRARFPAELVWYRRRTLGLQKESLACRPGTVRAQYQQLQ
jgi:hypothetical protein